MRVSRYALICLRFFCGQQQFKLCSRVGLLRHALGHIQASRWADSAVVQGRSLGYWRDLWSWPLALPLVRSPWPLLQVWGGDDALVPAAAYAHFAHLAARRTVPYCARRIGGADHDLQRPDGSDGVQQVWAWVEQWARAPQAGLCGPSVTGGDTS